MADLKVCELECLDKQCKKHKFHEFVGPVKIVLVESTGNELGKRKVWGSSVMTFLLLLMGATIFTVLFFSLSFVLPFMMNLHIMLCTLGFQLFMTMGILMFSTLFIGSMYMEFSGRKFQHIFLQISSVFSVVIGTVFVLGNMALTVHAITGLLAVILSVVAFVLGVLTHLFQSHEKWPLAKLAHKYFAVCAFVTGNLCFAFGLLKTSFVNWAPVANLNIILIVFCFLICAGTLATIYLRAKYFL